MPLSEQRNRIVSVCDFILQKGLVSFVFLLPLFFVPLTTEFFSFNKLYLFFVFTLVLLVSYALKMAVSKTFYVKRTFLDLPLLLILIGVALATIFSENKYYSIVGTLGNWEGSLITTVFLYIFYYVVVSNIKVSHVKDIISVLVVSTSISSLLFLFSSLGVNVFGQAWSSPYGFNTIGVSSAAVLFYSIVFPLSLNFLLKSKDIAQKVLYAVTSGLLAISVFGSVQIVGILTLLVGLTYVFFVSKQEDLKQTAPFLLGALIISLLVLLISFGPVKNKFGFGLEIPGSLNPSYRDSWIVSSLAIGEKPFFGTGPNTYFQDYTRFKAQAVNATDIWDLRFNQASSRYVTSLATTGILGLLTWVLLVYFLVKIAIRGENKVFTLTETEEDALEDRKMYLGSLHASVLALLFSWLFSSGSLSALIVFFVLMGLVATCVDIGKKERRSTANVSLSVLIAALVFLGASSYFGYRAYASDFLFRESLVDLTRGGVNTYDLQRRAVILNPLYDLYRRNYAQTNLALASAVSQKENLTDQDAEDIRTLISQAVREIRVATEVLAPLNVENWEVRGAIYRNLNSVASDAMSWALNAYNTAISLDPASPRLRIDLGGIYFTAEDYQNAATVYSTAIRLKNDYANAHYNLAQALKKLEDWSNAKTELEIVLRLIPAESEDAKRVNEELAEAVAKVAQLQALEPKPTVQQLEAETQSPTIQPPLAGPDRETNFVEGQNINLPREATPSAVNP